MLHPSAWSRAAIAAPRPRAAPVTIAALTGRDYGVGSSGARPLRRPLHGSPGRRPRRPRPAQSDAAARDPRARPGHARRRAGVHRRGRAVSASRLGRDDSQDARDARERACRPRCGLRHRSRPLGALRRALGRLARLSRRRRLRDRRRVPRHAVHRRGGLPGLHPLRHARGLDLALGGHRDAGADRDRRRADRPGRLACRRRGRCRRRAAATSRARCSRRPSARPRRRTRSGQPFGPARRPSRRSSATARSERPLSRSAARAAAR